MQDIATSVPRGIECAPTRPVDLGEQAGERLGLQSASIEKDYWVSRELEREESANLPAPEVIASEIAEDLQAALEQFSTIAQDLG